MMSKGSAAVLGCLVVVAMTDPAHAARTADRRQNPHPRKLPGVQFKMGRGGLTLLIHRIEGAHPEKVYPRTTQEARAVVDQEIVRANAPRGMWRRLRSAPMGWLATALHRIRKRPHSDSGQPGNEALGDAETKGAAGRWHNELDRFARQIAAGSTATPERLRAP